MISQKNSRLARQSNENKFKMSIHYPLSTIHLQSINTQNTTIAKIDIQIAIIE